MIYYKERKVKRKTISVHTQVEAWIGIDPEDKPITEVVSVNFDGFHVNFYHSNSSIPFLSVLPRDLSELVRVFNLSNLSED